MGIVRVERQWELRLGHAGMSPNGQRQAGVYVEDEIPAGAFVIARVHRPVELNEIDRPAETQGYLIQRAPEPPAFNVGGAPPVGVTFRGRMRTLRATGTGGFNDFIPQQHEPVWASFAPSATGDLVQDGRIQHALQMPGTTGFTPDLASADRNLLRVRWLGTAVAGATLVAVVAATRVQGSSWTASAHKNLAPGSIIVTLPTSGGILRDNGAGRLVGADGDGEVDYLTGAFEFRFNVAETGNVLVDYEHGCLYRPLNIFLGWDGDGP
jgi:hypothetical protein